MVVIDIQMPENCYECPLYERLSRCCSLDQELGCIDRYGYDANERPEWCPIMVVHDPNDLVSRKAAINKFEWYDEEEYLTPGFISIDNAVKILEKLPCDIKAGEKDEDLINAKDVFQIIDSVAKEQFTLDSSYESVLRALLEVNSRVFRLVSMDDEE